MEVVISKIAENKIIENALEYNTEPMVRIYVDKVLCSSAKFAIVFDDKREGDEVTAVGEINILTDTQYVPNYTQGIKIDYTTSPTEGFLISSLNPKSSGCSGCSGCSYEGHQNHKCYNFEFK